MMNSMPVNIYPAQNHTRKLVLLVIILCVTPFFIFIFLRFIGTGRVALNLTGSNRSGTIQIVNQSSSKVAFEGEVKNGSFNKTLPAGQYEIRIVSDDKKMASSYFLSVPRFFRTTNKSAELHNQANRQKLDRNVSNCPVLAKDQLYSYTCGWSNTLTRHIPLTSQGYSSRQDSEVSGIVAASAYRDGIITLRITNDGPNSSEALVISFVRNDEIIANRALPPNPSAEGSQAITNYQIVSDPKNPESFAISKKGFEIEALYYKNFDTEPKLIKSGPSEQALSEKAGWADLYDNRLLLSFGEPSNNHDDIGEPGTKKDSKRLQTVIKEYNASALNESPKEYKTDQPMNKVSFCGDSICLLSDTKLFVYEANGKRLRLQGAVNDVSNFIPVPAQGLVYQQGQSLYGLNIKNMSATMLFGSDKFILEDLFPSDKGILAQTSLADSTNRPVAHTFLLATEPAASNTFIDDKLPYAVGNDIWDMDYYGTTILSTLILNSAVLDRGSGKLSYDQTEYSNATKQVYDQLTRDGFDPKNYTIGFIVSY